MLWLAAAVEVHTSKEVAAVNGTNLRLKCTFSSSSPISQHLSVTWNFQPEDLSSPEPVSETFTLHIVDAHLPKPTSPKACKPGDRSNSSCGYGQAQLECASMYVLGPFSTTRNDYCEQEVLFTDSGERTTFYV